MSLIHGDALTMLISDDKAITFVEWGYLGEGKFQRRNFRLNTLSRENDHVHRRNPLTEAINRWMP